MRKLDWESKILEICKKYEIDPEEYNENPEFQESVAACLGFPSYRSFQAFPNPHEVVCDMGNDLLTEHLAYAIPLVEDSCIEIEQNYWYNQDSDERTKQIDNLARYIVRHLSDNVELLVASFGVMKRDLKDCDLENISSWGEVPESIRSLLRAAA